MGTLLVPSCDFEELLYCSTDGPAIVLGAEESVVVTDALLFLMEVISTKYMVEAYCVRKLLAVQASYLLDYFNLKYYYRSYQSN